MASLLKVHLYTQFALDATFVIGIHMIDFNHLDNLLERGQELSAPEIKRVSELLLSETLDPERKAEILIKMHRKGESANEIAGFAREFKQMAVDPGISVDRCGGIIMDVCGTGADRLDTFNISTATMFVLAAAGIAVAKHGNRSITSQCGGADVLEALGVPIDLTPDQSRDSLEKNGLAFFFAPLFHPAFKQIAPVRRMLAEKGLSSIFNILGPLLNPAPLTHQLVGVSNAQIMQKYVEALHTLGRTRAWVVHGFINEQKSLGMDEISLLGPTRIAEVKEGAISVRDEDFRTQFAPDEQMSIESFKGGNAIENARIISSILSGEDVSPKCHIVLVNAAAAFVIAGKAATITEGLTLAREMVWSGKAAEKLKALRQTAQS